MRIASKTSEREPIGLLDTWVLIDLGRDPAALPAIPRISTVTLAELGLSVHTTTDMAERAVHTERLQRAESVFDPFTFTTDCARRFTHMAGLVGAAGHSPRPRRLDLMIAAVASVNLLPLYTRNPRDFSGLDTVLRTFAISDESRTCGTRVVELQAISLIRRDCDPDATGWEAL